MAREQLLPQDTLPKETKKTFLIVFVTLILDLLAFTLILPLMPKLLEHYKHHDTSGYYKIIESHLNSVQSSLGLPITDNSVLLGGLIGSWFSFLQFVSAPIFGALSDHYGRKPILIVALIFTTCSYVFWYTSSRLFSLFLVARTVAGLSKSNISLSLAVVTDVSNEKSRGKGMAIVGAAFSLAFIFGPLLGALFASLSKNAQSLDTTTQAPATVAILLSLANLFVVWRFFDETHPVKVSKSVKSKDFYEHNILDYVNPCSLLSFKPVERDTSTSDLAVLRRLGLIYFLYLALYSGLEFTLAFLTHVRFDFSSMDQGKLYLFSGIIMACLQGGYIRRMQPGKEGVIATVGLFLIIPSFIVMGLSTSVSHIYLSLVFYAISSAVVVPCLTARASAYCHENHKGVTLGIFRSIGALARALGPGVASACFWLLGSLLTYCGGAMLLSIPLILMKKLEKSHHKCNLPTSKNTVFKPNLRRPYAA